MDTSKRRGEPKDFMGIGSSPVPGLTLRCALQGHAKEINRIAWSPDGQYLASPSDDTTIRIWDVESGECAAKLEEHRDRVNTVAWSPNGRLLASCSYDRTIRLWDVRNGQQSYI